MRKFLASSLFFVAYASATLAQSFCNKQAPKISFTGKAPSVWEIDGKTKDWKTILGNFTGDNATPYMPPASSSFNWVDDQNVVQTDPDNPTPENDIRLTSFIHDDSNLHFYFRRLAKAASSSAYKSFYYFFDVNGDAVMNLGEPVVYGYFTNKKISDLAFGYYVPDPSEKYSAEKSGNFLTDQGSLDGVNAYPLPGTVVFLFDDDNEKGFGKLKKREIFDAELTDDGYGVELAIPWRYLRNWVSENEPLKPGEIFFYKTSLTNSRAAYNDANVVENVGSCSGGPAISGNVALSKSLSTTVVTAGQSYKFDLKYKNLTNAATEVGVQRVVLKFAKTSNLPVNADDFNVVMYPDPNCNGVVDAGEVAVEYNEFESVDYDAATNTYTVTFPTSTFDGAQVILPPYGQGCLIATVTLPASGVVSSFRISFETSVFFVEGKEPCEPSCGGKPVNEVGFVEDEVSSFALRRRQVFEEVPGKDVNTNVNVYPNPSRGTANLVLPGNADVTVEDNLGRTVRRIGTAKAGTMQLTNLKPGFYIVKVRDVITGKLVTKKLIVQQ